MAATHPPGADTDRCRQSLPTPLAGDVGGTHYCATCGAALAPQHQKGAAAGNATKDRWDRTDILAKIGAALLVPVVLWYLGDTRHREEVRSRAEADSANVRRQAEAQKTDAAQRQADRITLLVRYYASPVRRERLAGLRISEYLARSQQFPQELVPIVADLARSDEDTTVQATAIKTLRVGVAQDVARAQGPSGPPQIALGSSDARRDINLGGVDSGAVVDTTRITSAVSQAVTNASVRSFADQSLLWVDDKPANNQDLITAFSKLGIRIDTALSTTAGLQALNRSKYGAIVSDISRGADGRAGLVFLDSLNARGVHPPVLFYSSVTDSSRVAEAGRLGAVGVTNVPSAVFNFVTAVLRRQP